MVVERPPEERFVGEAEDEEVAGLGALAKNVGDLFDVGVGHPVGVVGDGRVVDERPDDGFRQRGIRAAAAACGGRGDEGGGGGGDYGVVTRVDEGEETRDGEEGDEGEDPETA